MTERHWDHYHCPFIGAELHDSARDGVNANSGM